MLAGLLGLATGTRAPASVLSAVNLARASVCAPGHGAPLTETPEADRLARQLLHGESLHAALGALPVHPAYAGSLHLVAPPDDHAVSVAAAGRFCRDLAAPGVRELGAARAGSDLWIVVVAPLDLPRGTELPAIAETVLERVNRARQAGRQCGARYYPPASPLALSALLSRAAAGQAGDMSARDVLAHEGRDGSSPGDRVRREGYPARIVGENIASGVTDADEAVDGWLASPPHCANIMDPRFSEMGLAFAAAPHTRGGIYWSQVFAAAR